MAEVIKLSADQLTDADCDRLFGTCYWYPGPAAMRERLGPAELRGYRRAGIEGVVGLLTEEDPVALYPWTPAVAAGIRDEEAVALALLQAAQAAARAVGRSLASTLRDREGSRARAHAGWLRGAGFYEVSVRAVMARDLARPPDLPGRAGLAWEALADPEAVLALARACHADSPDPLAASLGAEGWLRRLWQLREGRMGPYLPHLSELLLVEGRPAGFSLATERGPALRFPAGWVYLADMGVLPGLRRQGLGSILLARFLASSRKQAYEWASLVVAEENRPAEALYRTFDFRPRELVTVGRWDAGPELTPAPGTDRSGCPPG